MRSMVPAASEATSRAGATLLSFGQLLPSRACFYSALEASNFVGLEGLPRVSQHLAQRWGRPERHSNASGRRHTQTSAARRAGAARAAIRGSLEA